jgi:hypothetical protein
MRIAAVIRSSRPTGSCAKAVKQAVKYVYGIDDAEREFVDKLISSDRPPSLLERLRDRRRQKYAPT